MNTDEFKYLIEFINKEEGLTAIEDYKYDKEKQMIFESIMYSALSLYRKNIINQNKINRAYEKFKYNVENTKINELNEIKTRVLKELNYDEINETNALEVYNKIAENMTDERRNKKTK